MSTTTIANEIPDLLEEIAHLSDSDLTPRDFFIELIGRAKAQTPSSGFLIWDNTQSGHLTLLLHCGAEDTQIHAVVNHPGHRNLIADSIQNRRCRLVAANFIDPETKAANPTENPVLIAPITAGPDVEYLVEILLCEDASSDVSARTQAQETLGVWEVIAGLVANYVRSRKLERQSELIQWQANATDFRARISRSLDPLIVAMSIANEARNLIQCDRVTVLTTKRDKATVTAVSGQAELNNRSNSIRLLQNLANRALKVGELFDWSIDDTEQQPPQIEEPLQEYIDHSLANLIAIHPLWTSVDDEAIDEAGKSKPKRELIGAIVVEQFSGQNDIDRATLRRRTAALSMSVAIAIANARQHHQIFMLPLWSTVGKAWHAIGMKRSLAITGGLLVTAIAAWIIPADFNLSVEGQLQPKRRSQIFATDDGTVREINVHHGQVVTKDMPLLSLQNNLIDNEILRVSGELNAAQKKLASIESARIAGQVSSHRDHEYAIEEESLAVSILNYQKQHQVLVTTRDELTLRSNIAGEVLTWNVDELLQDRPVQRGQSLLTVADTAGPWMLQLQMPDRRMGHLLAARSELGDQLPVEFVLATEPDKRYFGKLSTVARSTTQAADTGQSVLVTVAIDADQIDTLRPGAVATAKVFAGRKSIGFVWLHDVFEFIQSKILFRIW
ncbi:MAG: efflux RND transporter periplasmic adaptor subunit [Rubripirellula sp.]